MNNLFSIKLTIAAIDSLKHEAQKKSYSPINPRFKNREKLGFYHTIFKFTLANCPEDLNGLIRLNVQQYNYILSIVGPDLIKTSLREPISPNERLVLALRYLTIVSPFF